MKVDRLKYLKFSTAVLVVFQILFFQKLFAEDKSKISISFSMKDSLRQATALVTKADSSGKETPVKGVEVLFYVKKSFGLLPLEGDNLTTNDNGEATVDFPGDIPGDSFGNVTVIAKVEDNEEVGSLETMQTVKWGKPVVNKEILNQRALWASGKNAPIPLVIIVTGMIAGAWAVIIYIIILLFQIKKSGKHEIENQI
jgi:hypothetical protein